MTIGIGMICSGGFILGADSLFEGEVRTEERKLWAATHANGISWVLVGAGPDQGIRAFRDRLYRLFAEPPGDDLREELDSLTVDFWDDTIYNHPDYATVSMDIEPDFILSLSTPTVHGLFTVRRSAVAQVLEGTVSIGTGSPVADYLMSTLFRPACGMDTNELLAAYVLAQAKRFGTGCGGPSQMALHRSTSKPRLIHSAQIERDEAYFTRLIESAGNIAHLGLTWAYGEAIDAEVTHLQKWLHNARQEHHSANIPYNQAELDERHQDDERDWDGLEDQYIECLDSAREAIPPHPPTPTPDPSPLPPSPESPGGSDES